MAISQNFPIEGPTLNLNFANSKVLDPRVTFTRTTTGTYMDDNGLIVTAPAGSPRFDHRFIENTNLFTYSEDFSNTFYTLYATDVTVVTNTAMSPDGTTTADLIREGTANSGHFIRPVVATDRSAFRAISIYAKASGRSRLMIQDNSYSGNYFNATYDLNTGTVVSTFASANSTLTSASIVPVDNGWFRCILIGRPSNTFGGNSEITFNLSDGTTTSYTGNGTSGILMWGAQFEVASSVSDYIPTTTSTVSRSTIESLGLLIEEQKTNLLSRSEELDNNATWATDNSGLTVTANSVISPDGTQDADTLTEANTNTVHNRYQSTGLLSTSSAYTFSVFVKPNTVTRVQLGLGYAGLGGGGWARFDLSTGTVISTTASGSDPGSNLSASTIKYPNGWYRCIFTVTPSRSDLTYYTTIALLDSSNNTTYQGNTANNLYAWGAQLEVGSFPTSYIPTTASTVTRTRDDASLTGTNFTSWYNQSLGTFVCTAKYTPGNTTAQTAWSMYNGSTGAIRQMFNGAPGVEQDRGLMQNEVPTGTYSVSINSGVTASRNNLVKVACAFQTDNFAISQDGSVPLGDTSGTMSNHVNLYLGATLPGTWLLNGHLCQLLYYPVRVSNSLLQTLSR